MARGVSILMLGIVLLLGGLAASWAQDVAAPWVNQAEAQIGSTLSFDAAGGDYRVITSGPSRPEIAQTACTIATAGGGELRVRGGKDVNAADRLGVSRVLGFEAPAGSTQVTCENLTSRGSAFGRFNVVSADGPVSVAILVAFGLGFALLAAGLLLAVRGYRRARSDPG